MVKKVLMICLGNICRSPIAEGVFGQTVKERKLEHQWSVDSAALGGWHVGNPPDSRALSTMNNHSIDYKGRARQIKDDDFKEFDYIFGMDENNIKELRRMQPSGTKAKILLLGDFDPQGDRIIRDPYYDSGSQGFEKCYKQCVRSVNAFLDQYQD